MRTDLRTYRAALVPILLSFVGCSAVALASVAFWQHADWTNGEPDFPRNLLTRAWVHWDAGWYVSIASGGYWYKPGEQSPVAFFPVYPAIIGGLHALGANRFIAGILVTAVAGLLGLLLFKRWAAQVRDEATAQRATVLFVLYPFAFYLYGALYSDAVFLLLVVSTFYALERDKLWLVVALGIIATAARPVAPALVLGLIARRIELQRARGERVQVTDFVPALAALGFVGWMIYLGYNFGDPYAFATVQAAPGWDQPVGWRTWLKLNYLESLFTERQGLDSLVAITHGVIALSTLAMAVVTWRRWSKGYAVYLALVIGIPTLSSKDFMGLGRYAIAAFPVFITLALVLEHRPRLRLAWVIGSTVGLILLTAAFAADKYVA